MERSSEVRPQKKRARLPAMDAPNGDVTTAFDDVIRLLIQRGDLDLRVVARLACVARPLWFLFAPFLADGSVLEYRLSALERRVETLEADAPSRNVWFKTFLCQVPLRQRPLGSAEGDVGGANEIIAAGLCDSKALSPRKSSF